VIVLGFGMTLVVAPLTTTVMNAVDPKHAGIASGVNNAVSRIAGLMAIAVLGILLVTSFSSRAGQSLDRIALSSGERGSVDRELPKLAGAEIENIPAAHRAPVRQAIDESFVAAFRIVMLTAAAVAACAGVAGIFTG
jgi:hypothetical protein